MARSNTAPVADITKAAKARTEKAKQAEVAAVCAREVTLRDANGKARDALALAITGRFTDLDKVAADDLLPVYPDAKQAKTRANRASELNATLAVAHLIGAENAEKLLADCLTYGSRLRDDWAKACTIAKGHMNRIIGTGTARAAARPEAMRATLADLKAARALDAIRDEAASKGRAAAKAVAASEAAARYVARLDAKVAEGQDVGDALADAEKAADKAAKAAKAAITAADKAKAKLPAKTPEPPRSPETIVQDVKVALGNATLPRAALHAIAADLRRLCAAAGENEAADTLADTCEILARK